MPEQVTYDFPSAIQKKIVAMLMFEANALATNMDVVRPELFDHPALRDIVSILNKFVNKYRRHPSLEEIETEFNELIASNPRIIEEEHREAFASVLEQADGNYDYVFDKVVTFARHQAIRNAIEEASEKMRRHKNPEEIAVKLRDLLNAGETERDHGVFYFADLENRIERRASGLTRADLAIPTNIPTLDKALGGGLGRGELGIVMGPMKRGKTMFSVNMVYGAMERSIKVLHVIMEGSADRLQVLYDTRISGISKEDVAKRENAEAVRAAVNAFYGQPGVERLNVKHYAAQSCSPMAIETHLKKMQLMNGFEPELIVVDYLGLMVSNHKEIAKSGDRYLMFGQITKELLSLAQRGGYAIWLLHQSTRGSKSKRTVDLEDSADSIEPMRDADIILTLNLAPTENDANENSPINKIRIFLAGGREVADRVYVDVAIDKRYCRIEDIAPSRQASDERRPTSE